jgi:RHS repeat-associated protein
MSLSILYRTVSCAMIFVRLFALLSSALASTAAVWADVALDRTNVLVKVRGSYTSGMSSPSMRVGMVTGLATVGDPPEIWFSANVSGSTEERHFVLPAGVITEFHVDATNLTDYLVTFAVPDGYAVQINGIERNAVYKAIGGSGLDTLEVMLVRANRPFQSGARAAAGELGEASSIFVAPPKSDYGQPSLPEMEFNMGRALNGEALPPLNLLLNDSGYWGAQGGFERYIHPDVDFVVITADTTFRLNAPQVSVVFDWTGYATAAPPSNSLSRPRNFRLRFYETQTSATPFVTYDVTFGLETISTNVFYYTSATVTKTVGSAFFTTKLQAAPGNSWQDVNILGSWTTSDWHRGTFAQRNVAVTRTRTQITPLDFDYSDAVSTTDGQSVAAGSQTITYRRIKHDYIENGTPYSQRTQSGSLINDGGLYNRQILLDPQNRPIGSIQSSGDTAVGEYAGTGPTLRPIKLYRTWLDDSPSYNSTTGVITPGNSEVTEYLYQDDWNHAPVLPSSIRRKRNTTLLGETTITYADSRTYIRNGGAVTADHPILAATRYDFVAVGTTGNATTPRTATDGTSLKTVIKRYRQDTANRILVNRAYSVERPDGTKVSYLYETGTADTMTFPDSTGTDVRVTALNGITASGSGIITIGSLASGSFTVDVDSIGLVANKSTKTVTVLQRGLPIRREVYVFTGGNPAAPTFESVGWDSFAYNSIGELTGRASSSNTSYSATWSADRSSQAISDETGMVTTLAFDTAQRVSTVARSSGGSQLPSVVTTIEYDGQNRVRKVKEGPSASNPLVTERQYNAAGLVEYLIEPGGHTTRYNYTASTRDLEITYHWNTPEATTATITRAYDGRTKSITGDPVIEERYSYSFESGTGRPQITRRLGPIVAPATEAKRPVVTTFDLLGRVVEEKTDGFVGVGSSGSGKPMITYHEYNAKGLPSKVYSIESGPTPIPITGEFVMEYDEFGRLSAAGLNLDGTIGLQPGGIDRYQAFSASFDKDANSIWWALQSQKVYHTNGSALFHEATQRTQLGTIPAQTLAYSKSTDFYGNTSSETVKFASSATAGNRRVLTTMPNGTTLERTMVHGFVTAENTYDANNAAGTTATLTTTYTYDVYGRLEKAVDGRTQGTPQISYYPGTGRPYQIRDPRGVIVSTHVYDPAARLESTTTPAGTKTYKYNPRSQLVEESGTSAFPSKRTYTVLGELERLKTYRNGITGLADETVWTYDPNTGWLDTKSDASGQLTSYDYSFETGYRNVIRTWARSNASPIETTYKYALNTGDLMNVNYNDVDTPDIAYTYTRTGQIKTVSDAAGLRTLHYNREQLQAEYLPAFFNNLVLSPNYQSTTSATSINGRYSGYRLGADSDTNPDNGISSGDREMSVNYGYDALGRINAVTTDYLASGSRSALSVPSSYRYKGGSTMWDLLTQGSYTLERGFENNRDVLNSITSAHTAVGPAITAPVTRNGYETDDVGRRTWGTQTGMAFADMIDADATFYRYNYDARGQLADNGTTPAAQGYRGTLPTNTTTPMPGRGFGYTYDTAGNRLGASVGSDGVSYRSGPDTTDTAGGNTLNQTRSRGTLKTHVSGTSNPGATVTVGGVTASRTTPAGRYWDAALPTYSQNATLQVSAAMTGEVTQNADIRAITRPQNEVLTYDEDGNLTSDSQWVYQWDAENRLKGMSTNTNGGWSAPDRQLTFTYDYLGRRIRKESWENNIKIFDRKFIYEGWNLIAELDTATNTVVRSYTWGLDIASSLTATGGVGALTLETVHTSTTLTNYHLAYDGSGNVTALVNRKPGDSTDGKIVASYEYGPFGEKVRTWIDPTLPTADKDILAARAFRFSTKFTDVESGLVYYGLRYYDPSLGRFINRDPIGEAGGANLYGFVGNSPVNAVDVLGMWRWEFGRWVPEDGDDPNNPPPDRDSGLRGSAGQGFGTSVLTRPVAGTEAVARAQEIAERSAPNSEAFVIGLVVTRGLPEAIAKDPRTLERVIQLLRRSPILLLALLNTSGEDPINYNGRRAEMAGVPVLNRQLGDDGRELLRNYYIPNSADEELVRDFFNHLHSDPSYAKYLLDLMQRYDRKFQVHHFLSNVNKIYSPQYEVILKKYGLNVNDNWNKAILPQSGKHPIQYHDFVLDELRKIDAIANGNKEHFLKLFEERIVQPIRQNPDRLYKTGW